jgi:transcriptional regulator with XRE-family HTH domain
MAQRDEIAKRIAWLREEQLLTRGELARKAGVSVSTITNAEEGEMSVRLSTLRKIAEALEVEPSELIHPRAEPALSGKAEAPPEPGRPVADLGLARHGKQWEKELEEAQRTHGDYQGAIDKVTREMRQLADVLQGRSA